MKSIVLPIVLLLLASQFSAQTLADPLPASIQRHLYFSRFAEAKNEAEQAYAQRSSQPESHAHAVAAAELGRVRSEFARYAAADTLLRHAAERMEKLAATADSAYLKTCLWLAINCRVLAQFPEAETALKKGLQAADQCRNTPHEAFRSDLLLEYANWDNEMSRYQQANLHYQQAADFSEKFFGKKHQKLAAALTAWAVGQIVQGNFKKGGELLDRARRILEPQVERYPREYLVCLRTQASLFGWGAARYREAEVLYEKAIVFGEKKLGERHSELAEVLRTAASHFQNFTPKFNRADTLLRRALAIYEGHFGRDYPNCAGVLQDISTWQGWAGYTKQAAQTRQEAFDIAVRVYGNQHPQVADLMLNLAENLQKRGETEQANNLFQQAEKIYARYFNSMHQSQHRLLSKKASMAFVSGNRRTMDSLMHKALHLAEQIHGKGSEQWWFDIGQIAAASSYDNQQSRADSLYDAIAIFRKIHNGENSIAYAQTLSQKSWLQKEKGQLEKAAATLWQYQTLVESIIGRENLWFSFSISSLNRILIEQKQFGEAEKRLSNWEATVRKVFGEKSQQMVGVLDDKIDLYQATRTPLETMSLRREKLALQREIGDDLSQYIVGLIGLSRTLSEMGYFSEAQLLLDEAAREGEKFGKNNVYYTYTLMAVAGLQMEMSNFSGAKKSLEAAEESIKSMGSQSGDLGLLQTLWFSWFLETSHFDKAEANILGRMKVPNYRENTGDCNLYGLLCLRMNRFDEAEKWFRKGLEVAEKNNEKPEYISTVQNNLSQTLAKKDNYAEALRLIETSVKTTAERFGTAHPDYAMALQNQAALLDDLARHDEAEKMYRQALSILEKTNGREHTDYANTLNNLAINLSARGKFNEAIDSLREVIRIIEKAVGKDHPKYIFYRQNLADTYLQISKDREADQIIQQNLDFWKKRAPRSLEYASALNSLGQLCRYTGQYDRSLGLHREALAIQKEVFGTANNRLTFSMVQISQVLRRQKKYAEAIQIEREGMAIDSTVFGKEHPFFPMHLHNLGQLHLLQNQPQTAERLLLASIELRSRLRKDELHVDIARSYSTLAMVYKKLGKLDLAEKKARRGLEILQPILGKEHIDYALLLGTLGDVLLTKNRQSEEALAAFREYQKIQHQYFKNALGYLSTSEQAKLWEEYKMDILPTAALENPRIAPLAEMCFNNALLTKGAALRSSRTLRQSLENSKDTAQLRQYDQYLASQRAVAAEYRLLPEQRTRLDSLENASRRHERELLERSPAYRAHLDNLKSDWREVQQKLQPGEAAIEFVRFNRLRVIETDTFRYAALVLLPGGAAPVFVPLCLETELDTLQNNRDRNFAKIKNLYDAQHNASSRAGRKGMPIFDFYKKLWQPFDSLLAGVKRVYFSPDGLLHRISFAAIGFKKGAKTVRLCDRYELVQVATTNHIHRAEQPSEYSDEVLVVGNIDYGKSTNSASSARGGGDLFDPLEGANGVGEFSATCQVFSKNGKKVATLSGKEATEQAVLRHLDGSKNYRAVSLITHGFFLPVPDSNWQKRLRYLFSEKNPMQRSCLVFAGVNEIKDSMPDPATDGLLTAQDFAGLNLKKTEVVIVSACQSGLGDVSGNEGVFGLQRAFREAGARYLIVSQWDLPDDPGTTDRFMKNFYENWLEKKMPVPEAFRATQQKLKDESGDDVGIWGGLILIE